VVPGGGGPCAGQEGGGVLLPFAHRLSEELGSDTGARELQRLRCRVQYHALRFIEPVRRAADAMVARLRSAGPFIAIHMRFEKDMLAFAG